MSRPPDAGRPGSTTAAVLVGLALAALMVAQSAWIRATSSATYDEVVYLELGLNAYQRGDFVAFIPSGVPPVPILVNMAWPALAAGGAAFEPAQVPGLVWRARVVGSLAFGVPLVLAVFAWLTRRRGLAAGAIGGALMALSPSIVAHASLANTDACVSLMILVALAVLWWYRQQPTPARLAAVGAAIGLALAAKQSSIVLFPVALLWLALTDLDAHTLPRGARPLFGWLVRLGLRLTAVVFLALLVDWALYAFATRPVLPPGASHPVVRRLVGEGPLGRSAIRFGEWLPMPASVATIFVQIGHGVHGHESFLLGRRSVHGFRAFIPAALLFKSTPVELLLAVVTPILLLWRRAWREPTAQLWALAFLGYLGLAMLSTLNMGHRYVLPLYPLLILLGVDALCGATAGAPRRLWLAGGLLVAIQGIEDARIAPRQLSYFNDLAGGPAGAYHLLVDSSLDWGQDLPALRSELDRVGGRTAISYFGTVRPSAHGIDAVPWDDPDASAVADCRWLAVSVTYLQGVYLGGDPWAALRNLNSDARAGYSILLYDLHRPEVRAALDRARATRDLDPLPAAPSNEPAGA